MAVLPFCTVRKIDELNLAAGEANDEARTARCLVSCHILSRGYGWHSDEGVRIGGSNIFIASFRKILKSAHVPLPYGYYASPCAGFQDIREAGLQYTT